MLPGGATAAVDAPTGEQPGMEILHSDSAGLLVELSVPNYTVQQKMVDGLTYEQLEVPGYSLITESGVPQLPVKGLMIGVPAGAEVQINILEDDAVGLAGQFNLAAAPYPVPLEDETDTGSYAYLPGIPFEHAGEYYPQSPIYVGEDGWVRDQRVARLVFSPFQYQSNAGSLIWHRRVLVEINFIEGIAASLTGSDLPAADQAGLYDPILRGALLNYDAAQAWRSMPEIVGVHTTSVEGERVKIQVDEDGIYKVTYEDLATAGWNPSTIDPATLSLSSQGENVAISIVGEVDGSFDPGDYILFYGEEFRGERMAAWYADEDDHWLTYLQQRSDGTTALWHPEFTPKMLELYTSINVYWLWVDPVGEPLRMAVEDATPVSSLVQDTYQATARAERNLEYWEFHFTDEDPWFWEYIESNSVGTYPITVTGLPAAPANVTIRGELVSWSSNDNAGPDHHTVIEINTTSVDEAYWDGISRYHFEATVSSSALVEGINLIKYHSVGDTVVYPQMLVDWFEIIYDRCFLAVNDELMFSGDEAGTWQYQVTGLASSTVQVLDIISPLQPVVLSNAVVTADGGGYRVAFDAERPAGAQFYLAGDGALKSPLSVSVYNPPDLRSSGNQADYIIITHPDFLAASQVLANYRSEQMLQTLVVNVEDIYNEFGEGIFHSQAIKNFLEYTFSNWQPPAPSYVVLIGDGHWNMHGWRPADYGTAPVFMPPNLEWVDPWHGLVDTTTSLANVVGPDSLPDLEIGRIPVNTVAEFQAVINKIETFETSTPEEWQLHNLFIADNTPDYAGNFPALANAIISDYQEPGFTMDKIYLDDFMDTGTCGTPLWRGSQCPNATQAIKDKLDTTGAQIVNYIGHASYTLWTNERVFSYRASSPYYNDVADLDNGDRLPVVLAWTCLEGFWFHPVEQPSMAELFLRTDGRGAVATFSPTGLGVANGHDALQRGFYDAVYEYGVWTLGPAVSNARLRLFGEAGNHPLIYTYLLFGDPALKLLSPYGLEASPSEAHQTGPTDAVIDYTLSLTNTGMITDTYDLSVSGNTWVTNLPYGSVTLAAGENRTLTVQVQIPAGVSKGSTDTAVIQIQSRGDQEAAFETHLVTTADVWVVVSPTTANAIDLPGAVVTYNFQATNTSDQSRSFNLALGAYTWFTQLEKTVIGPLAPGASANFWVRVNIPAGAADYDFDATTVTLASQTDARYRAVANITTTARTYGVSISPASQNIEGAVGTVERYWLQIANTGGYPDTYDLSTASALGWVVTPSVNTVGPLAVGGTTGLWVDVRIPPGIPGGTIDTTLVQAQSQADQDVAAQASLVTTARVYGVEVSPTNASVTGLPGAVVTYNFQVTNTGGQSDSFDLALGAYTWPTQLEKTVIGPLSPGASANFWVRVSIPAGVADYDLDATTLALASQKDARFGAVASMTTTARTYGVSISPASQNGKGLTDTVERYWLQIANTGGYPDTYDLSAASALGWVVTPSVNTVGPLAVGGTTGLWVDVQIPSGIPGGTIDTARVQARSQADQNVAAQASLITLANVYGLELDPPVASAVGLPGTTVTYTFQVTNTSNLSDAFDLTVGEHEWFTLPEMVLIGPIEPGVSIDFTVRVDIPVSAADYDFDSTVITLTSHTDANRQAITTLTTTARTYGVDVAPVSQSKAGTAGTVVRYWLQVINTGGYPDTFNISVLSTQGWDVTPGAIAIGPLAAGETAQVWIDAEIPGDVSGGTEDAARVDIVSEGDGAKSTAALLYTTANVYGLNVTTSMPSQSAFPGSVITYTLQVTNLANISDTFSVTLGSYQWETSLSHSSLSLLAGEAGQIEVYVTVPNGSRLGDLDAVSVRLVSQGDPMKSAQLTLASSTLEARIFLPITMR
ncbi:MAG TPA: C25 family cysteine peptidase [Anaerolineales bacterium]|nr:C25 family cysteine peptidase [Anaerolineales bacterium]